MVFVYLLALKFCFVFEFFVFIIKNKRLNLYVRVGTIAIFSKLVHLLVKVVGWHNVLVIRTDCYCLRLISLLKWDKVIIPFDLLIFF